MGDAFQFRFHLRFVLPNRSGFLAPPRDEEYAVGQRRGAKGVGPRSRLGLHRPSFRHGQPGIHERSNQRGPTLGGAMRVNTHQRSARLQYTPRFRKGATHHVLVVLVGPLGIAVMFARLRHRFSSLRGCGKCEVLGIQIADDAPQPDVEERRKIGVVDAAVVRRIGDDGIERGILVGQAPCVASRSDRWLANLRQLAHAKELSVESKRQAALGLRQAVDLREVVNHLDRLAVAYGPHCDLVLWTPPCELVEAKRQTAESHSEVSDQCLGLVFVHAGREHFCVGDADLFDQGEEHQQLARRVEFAPT